jgi:hypothetical protein
MSGTKLPHTTINFDERMYELDSEKKLGYRFLSTVDDEDLTSEEKLEEWLKYGFDIALPTWDTRARPIFLTSENALDYITPSGDYLEASNLKSRVSELLSILEIPAPDSSDFFFKSTEGNSEIGRPGFKIFPKSAAIAPLSASGVARRNPTFDQASTSLDWTAFQQFTVASERDLVPPNSFELSIKNADIVLTNQDTTFMRRFIESETNSAYNGMLFNFSQDRVRRILTAYYGALGAEKVISYTYDEDGGSLENDDPVVRFLMENTFVWVKCSFYADYITHEDFAQSLSPESSVIHKNLIVGSGDFDRFNRAEIDHEELSFDADRDTAARTRPYTPVTTPTVDIISQALVSGDDLEETIDRAFLDSRKPETKIGSLYYETFEKLLDSTIPEGSREKFTSKWSGGLAPLYFDPDSRVSSSAYADLPTLVPRDGNLTVNGRIFSPTIDELWIAIKQLAAGAEQADTPLDARLEGARPESTTPETERFKIKKHHVATQESEKILGDPVEIEYTFPDYDASPATAASFRVTRWVDEPTRFSYSQYTELKLFYNKLTTLISSGIPESAFEILSTDLPNVNADAYKPIPGVLSLKEVEALIKGVRFNLEVLYTIIWRATVRPGALGRPNGSQAGDADAAGGGLYQLHSRYQFDGGVSATHYSPDSTKGESLASINTVALWDVSKGPPSWSVFLGADGSWHSTMQACVIPVVMDSEAW